MNVRMRDCYRPPFHNLLAEKGDYTAVAAQHIAETGGYKRGFTNYISFLDSTPELCTYISASRLVAPITLLGFTALSVEIMMNFFTPYFNAVSAMMLVPRTLVRTPRMDIFPSWVHVCMRLHER